LRWQAWSPWRRLTPTGAMAIMATGITATTTIGKGADMDGTTTGIIGMGAATIGIAAGMGTMTGASFSD